MRHTLKYWFYLLLIISPKVWSDFDKNNQTYTTHPGEKSHKFTYVFTNHSNKKVHFKKIKTNCPCTQVTGELNIAPKETSMLYVTVDFGNKSGVLNTVIDIQSEDEKYQLKSSVSITPEIKLNPRFIRWGKNHKSEEKIINLKVTDPKTTQIKKITLDEDQFSYKHIASKDTGSHTLKITPTNTSSGRFTLEISTSHDKIYKVYLLK